MHTGRYVELQATEYKILGCHPLIEKCLCKLFTEENLEYMDLVNIETTPGKSCSESVAYPGNRDSVKQQSYALYYY